VVFGSRHGVEEVVMVKSKAVGQAP
jgi:hypothetical protein